MLRDIESVTFVRIDRVKKKPHPRPNRKRNVVLKRCRVGADSATERREVRNGNGSMS